MKIRLSLALAVLALTSSAAMAQFQAPGVSMAGTGVPLPDCGDSGHALAATGGVPRCQGITGTAAAGGTNLQVNYNLGGGLAGITGVTSDGTVMKFAQSDLVIVGSSTGVTAFTSDNAGATNFTLHVPAANDTIAVIGAAQTLTNKTLTSPVINTSLSGTAFGTNIPTFLLTPSSANLAAALTDETGSGAAVFGTSPTIASPTFSGTVAGSNTIPLSILAQSAANTMLGNWTGSTANVSANAMPSCTDTGGNHLNWVPGTGVTCGTSGGSGGGAVSVTSATGNVVISPSPGTNTFTVGTTFTNNAQTGTTYTFLTTDAGELVTASNASASTYTMPTSATTGFTAGFDTVIANLGAGVVTLSSSSPFLPAAPALAKGQSAELTSLGSTTGYVVSNISVPYMAADTIFGNLTSAAAWPVAFTVPTCANDGAHALVYTSHALACETISASGSGTVSSATSGQIAYYASSGTAVSGFTMAGDCTFSAPNITCTKSNGTLFATAAFAATGASGHTLPYLDGTNTWSALQSNCQTTLSISTTTFTPDGTCNSYKITLTGSDTIANPSAGMVTATAGDFLVCQDATGSRTATWGSQFVAASGVVSIVLSTTASVCDVIGYRVIDGTHILISVEALNATH